MTGTVLILGGTGKFGRHAAAAFWNAGWTVRQHDRATGDLDRDAEGAEVIVNAWNPPDYQHWAAALPAMTARVVRAAQDSGATVILPGNVYNFGAGAPERLTATTPHAATNPLGRLRIAVEESYRAAGVRTIVLRCGDFIDTRASGNWFDRVLVKQAGQGKFVWPGDPDAAHAFAFLPDAARAAVLLADRRYDLAPFEDVPFPGHTLTGRELAAAVGRVLGRHLALKRFPWWPLLALRPVWPAAVGLTEMRYLWSMPHRLDGGKLAALCPDFAPTPLDLALASALELQVGPDDPVARHGVVAAAE